MQFNHDNEGQEAAFEDQEDAREASNQEDAECGSENFDHDGGFDDSEPYDGGGWPGDGSGTDDLADYGANEAADYYNE